MKIAVTGASGYIGSFLLQKLVQSGVNVRALIRQRVPDFFEGELRSEVEWITGDLANAESLDRLVSGCTGVVHLAYNHVPGKYRGGEGSDPVEYWNTNFGSTISLIEASRSHGLERVVLLSSRAVFDGVIAEGSPITDSTTPRPTNHYGLLKYASEGMMNLFDDIAICALRPTGVYGVRRPIEKSKWFELVNSSTVANDPLDKFSNIGHTEVHGTDVAEAIRLLLDGPADQVVGRSFNCSDIVVSERFLVQLTRTIQAGESVDLGKLESPEPAQGVMNSNGLKDLNWKPGGIDHLVQTIHLLVDCGR